MFKTKDVLFRWGAGCGKSRMPGAKRGKIRRLLQRITYRNQARMRRAHKEAEIDSQ